jgi:hypothetical protein
VFAVEHVSAGTWTFAAGSRELAWELASPCSSDNAFCDPP